MEKKRNINNGFSGEPHTKTGYCADTKIFHSLCPAVPLPPRTTHLSAAAYALSLHSNSPWTDASAAFIDSTTGRRISYSQFRHYVEALALYLRTVVGLSKNDVAFVISPNSTRVPILYFSLLSLGVSICPANPLSTRSEISRQVVLSKPVVAFVTSATKAKVAGLGIRTIVLDSNEFESMMTCRITGSGSEPISAVEVNQDDIAAILFSSGTTGIVKAAMLTHRNFIAIIANFYHQRQERTFPAVVLCYVDDPKANSEILVMDGWLRTGDACYIDDEGFLFVVDRLKELIKYKGYQVPPAELEQLLHSHPDIVDAAVIPYPDEDAGQVPLAFIVRRPQSSLDEGQVMKFIAEQVAPYKKVRRVVFIDSIPKNASGKILRRELKKISLPHSKL